MANYLLPDQPDAMRYMVRLSVWGFRSSIAYNHLAPSPGILDSFRLCFPSHFFLFVPFLFHANLFCHIQIIKDFADAGVFRLDVKFLLRSFSLLRQHLIFKGALRVAWHHRPSRLALFIHYGRKIISGASRHASQRGDWNYCRSRLLVSVLKLARPDVFVKSI